MCWTPKAKLSTFPNFEEDEVRRRLNGSKGFMQCVRRRRTPVAGKRALGSNSVILLHSIPPSAVCVLNCIFLYRPLLSAIHLVFRVVWYHVRGRGTHRLLHPTLSQPMDDNSFGEAEAVLYPNRCFYTLTLTGKIPVERRFFKSRMLVWPNQKILTTSVDLRWLILIWGC